MIPVTPDKKIKRVRILEAEVPNKWKKVREPTKKMKWLHVYPDYYSIGMINIGYQLIWDTLLKNKHLHVERAFYPLKKTLESEARPSEFDVISFSIPYESTFLNLLYLLDQWEIEKNTRYRSDDRLIIIGGFAPTYNPAIYSAIADIIFIGDDVSKIDKMVEIIVKERKKGKVELLKKISHIPGVYVSHLYSTDKKFHPPRPRVNGIPKVVNAAFSSEVNYKLDFVVSPYYLQEYKNVALLEISRGCPHRCNFCALSYVYKPLFRSMENIIENLKLISRYTKKVRFVSSSESGYRNFCKILRISEELGLKYLRVGSQRADDIIRNHSALEYITYPIITLAPETGEDLRMALGKKIDDNTFVSAARLIKKYNKQLALFTIVNFPSEKEKDILQLGNLIKRIKDEIGEEPEVYVNNFMPMPRTPFQWDKLHYYDEFVEKVNLLKEYSQVEKIYEMEKWKIILSGSLERGDYLLSEKLSLEKNYEKLLKEEFDTYKGPFEVEKELPWEVAKVGVSKKYLLNRRREYYEKVSNI